MTPASAPIQPRAHAPHHAGDAAPPRVAARRLAGLWGCSDVPAGVIDLVAEHADVCWHASIPARSDTITVMSADGSRPVVHALDELRADPPRLTIAMAHALGHIHLPWHVGTCACRAIPERTVQLDDAFGLIESEAAAFAAELLVPAAWMAHRIDEEHPSLSIRAVAVGAGIPLAAAAAASARLLHAGMVWAVVDDAGYVHASGRSPGTPARVPEPGRPLDSADAPRLSERRESLRLGPRTLHVYGFPRPAGALPVGSAQGADSALVLTAIASDLHIAPADHGEQLGAVHGVVGGITVEGPLPTASELEQELAWRFRDRPHIARFTTHPRFPDFVRLRAREIAARRVGW